MYGVAVAPPLSSRGENGAGNESTGNDERAHCLQLLCVINRKKLALHLEPAQGLDSYSAGRARRGIILFSLPRQNLRIRGENGDLFGSAESWRDLAAIG